MNDVMERSKLISAAYEVDLTNQLLHHTRTCTRSDTQRQHAGSRHMNRSVRDQYISMYLAILVTDILTSSKQDLETATCDEPALQLPKYVTHSTTSKLLAILTDVEA